MKTKTQKHTPGPWHIGPRTRANGRAILWHVAGERKGTNLWVAETHETIYKDGRDGSEEANARLIVAAPDLLEAAKAAINHLEVCQAGRIHHPFESASLPHLRSAVRKAEGRGDS